MGRRKSETGKLIKGRMIVLIGMIWLLTTNKVSAAEIENNQLYKPQILQSDQRYIYTTKIRDQAVIIDTYPKMHIEAVLGKAERLLLVDAYLVLIEEQAWFDHLILSQGDTLNRRCSTITIYDIQDRANPKQLRKIEVEGTLESITFNKKSKQIHFVTYIGDMDKLNAIKRKEDFLPAYRDSAKGQMAYLLPFEKVYNVPKEFNIKSSVSVIGSFGLEENIALEMLAVVGKDQHILSTENEIFISTSNDYKRTINKIELSNRGVQYIGANTLPYEQSRNINMEYIKDTLFIGLISEQEEQVICHIVAIDKQMKAIGKYTFKANDKENCKINFNENKAYIQNLDQVLAIIDLSIPNRLIKSTQIDLPEIRYGLRSIEKNLAIEIGYVLIHKEVEGEWGATYHYYGPDSVYIKLFDTSNKSLKKLDEVTVGIQSSAVYNPDTAIVSQENQIVALPVFETLSSEEKVCVFKVQDNQLIEIGKLSRIKTYKGFYYTSSDSYVFSIGDKLYYLYNNEISEYQLKDLKYIGNMVIEIK